MRTHPLAFAVLFTLAPLTTLAADVPATGDGAHAARPATRPSGPGWASPVLPDGLGVNIHFTDPKAGEMEMLAGGFRIVRMDFGWGGIERKAGEYDLKAYDRLVQAAEAQHVKLLFILDYSNKLYDDGLSPHTDEGRAAFAKWAAASAQHFKGRGILWEMYNEPNIQFWKPKPNADDYAKLALAVGKALREAAPDEAYVGPATSTIDLPFLETCFKAGLLDYWSAVSVHPYRQTDPETALPEYRRLRQLIRQYAKDKPVPILSGEWGYSTGWKGFDEDRQGKYLARQWLTNLYAEVPVSIWYDWHDDGTDPKEAEHHFGAVRHEYRAGKDADDPVYEAKPSYAAAKALTTALAGYRYNKRLAVGSEPTDFVLVFSKGDNPREVTDVKLAVWTRSKEPQALVIPAAPGAFHVVDHLGQPKPDLAADADGLKVAATDAPLYLTPDKPNDLLRLAAAAERSALDVYLTGGRQHFLTVDMRNPLAEPIKAIGSTTGLFEPHLFPIQPGGADTIPCRAYIYRDAEPQALRVQVEVREKCFVEQWTHVIATNPLTVTPLPSADGKMALRVDNPSGQEFAGTVMVTDPENVRDAASRRRFTLDAGQTEATVEIPFVPGGDNEPYRFGLRVDDLDHNIAVKVPPAWYKPIDGFARLAPGADPKGYRVVAEGDAKGAAEVSLSANPPAAAGATDGPLPGQGLLRIKYQFDAGHRFLRLEPTDDGLKKVDGAPKSLSLWVNGDAGGGRVRMRFVDSTGQVFQRDAGRLTWKGWRHVTFPLDNSSDAGGHWAGAADGVIHYPIRLDTLFLLDAPGPQKAGGTVDVAGPVLVYP